VVRQEVTQRRYSPGSTVLIALLFVAALALRFWKLGDWSLDSDEVFMLRDSINPSFTNPRPLLYFLNHYVVGPFHPLDELGLRLLPAIFGAVAIPVFYLLARRLLGARAALFGALLLTFSPLHVYYSQFARYWSLVFLLSCVYPYAFYIGLRERSSRYLVLGVVTAVLAILAHPASVLPAVGFAVWLFATYLNREQVARLWRRKTVRWGTFVLVLVVGIAAVRLVGLLQGWISAHDTAPGGTEFLLSIPNKPFLKQILYILGFIDSLTMLLVVSGTLGLYLLWREDRSLALLLTAMLTFPLAFLVLLSFRTPVSTFYLLPTVPVLFLGAGYLLDRLAGLTWELRPAWLLPATLALVIVAEGAPTLVSQYRDGRRYDFRGAAQWLDKTMTAEDVIFSDQYKVVSHYLPGKQVRRLRGDPTPLMQAANVLHGSGEGEGALWVVAPAPSHAFRTNPRLSSLHRWIYENCQLRNTVGRTRFDYRQNLLQIFRCPPAGGGAVSIPGRAPSASKAQTPPTGL
jgi:mannosyltransferase